jgi:hypothetical protein
MPRRGKRPDVEAVSAALERRLAASRGEDYR